MPRIANTKNKCAPTLHHHSVRFGEDRLRENTQLLAEVTAFLYLEADLLDHKAYADWLELWSETGMYIVPVDHSNKDYKNSLNVAYDDAHMRKLRTDRLLSGEAVSTQSRDNTVRLLSRFRLFDEQEGLLTVRCAYCLFENNKGDMRTFPADVQFKLRREGESFKIEEKLVNIMQSKEHLTTVSYIF